MCGQLGPAPLGRTLPLFSAAQLLPLGQQGRQEAGASACGYAHGHEGHTAHVQQIKPARVPLPQNCASSFLEPLSVFQVFPWQQA